MLPVVRDLLKGIENLDQNREVFVEARHLRAVGITVPKVKKWVETNPQTGEGDFKFVDMSDTRPIGIRVFELRLALDRMQSPASLLDAAVPVVANIVSGEPTNMPRIVPGFEEPLPVASEVETVEVDAAPVDIPEVQVLRTESEG